MDSAIVYADPPPPADATTVDATTGGATTTVDTTTGSVTPVPAPVYNTLPLELRVTLDDGRIAITGLVQGVFRAHPDIPDALLEQAHQQLKAAGAL